MSNTRYPGRTQRLVADLLTWRTHDRRHFQRAFWVCGFNEDAQALLVFELPLPAPQDDNGIKQGHLDS